MIENPLELHYPDWGRGSIRDWEWQKLKAIMDKYNVKTVLEIGIGLSTMLMMQRCETLTGFDSWPSHIDFMRKHVSKNVTLHLWDGKTAFNPGNSFDLAFVDGPQGAINRKPAIASAIGHCKILAMHDTPKLFINEWQADLDPNDEYKLLESDGMLGFWERKL